MKLFVIYDRIHKGDPVAPERIARAKNKESHYSNDMERDTSENGTQPISISLAGNNAGSYGLYVSAKLGLVTVAEAEYYFIIN